MDGKTIRLMFGIALASFHVGVMLIFVVLQDEISTVGDDLAMVTVMALSFVQCSLLGTWAVLGNGPFWLRVPISFVLLISSQFSFMLVVDGWDEPQMFVSLAIMAIEQYFLIAGLIISIQISLKLLKMETYLDTNTRFSLGTLLIVTTLIAIAVGLGKFALTQLGLSMEMFNNLDSEFWIFPFLGVFNSLVVVMMLPALWVHRPMLKIILAFPLLLLAAATSGLETITFSYFFNDNAPWFIFPGLCIGQSFLFFITVFPLWRWKQEDKDSSNTKSKSLLLSDWKFWFKGLDQHIEQSHGYWLPLRLVWISMLLLVHLVLIISMSLIDINIDTGISLILLGYPIALVSMLASLAVLPSRWFWWRLSLSLGLLIPAWLLLIHVLDESITADESAGWAFMVLLHFSLAVLLLVSGKYCCRVAFSDEENLKSNFSLSYLILGVTLSACVFGGLRLLLYVTGWGTEVFGWQYFFFCVTLGVFQGIVAALVIACLFPKNPLVKMAGFIVSLILAGLSSVVCHFSMNLIFGDDGGVTLKDMFVLFESQAVILYFTIFPFWRWQTPLIPVSTQQEKHVEPDPLAEPEEVTPEASSPF